MKRRLGAMGAILAAVGLATAGCGETKQPAGAPVSGSGGAPDRTFTYADNNEIMVGWDPATSYSNENIAMSNMYEQLVRYDSETAKVEPLLAESWTSERGRPALDVQAARGRAVPHRPRARRRRRQGRDRAHDGDQRGRRLHLGRGQADQRARPDDARVRPQVRRAARPHRVRGLRRLHLRHEGGAGQGASPTGSPRATTRAPARTRSPSGTRAPRPSCGSRRPRTTGAAGTGEHYRAARVPPRAARHHRRAAAARPATSRSSRGSRRSSGSASKGVRGVEASSSPVVPEPADHAQHRVRPARGRARAQGRRARDGLRGPALRAQGRRRGGARRDPGRAARLRRVARLRPGPRPGQGAARRGRPRRRASRR